MVSCKQCGTKNAGFAAFKTSKFCSIKCGLDNAKRRVERRSFKALDAKIDSFRKGKEKACASDLQDLAELDAVLDGILKPPSEMLAY